MSEINKPENDSTDLKCPFNPDQYKIDAIAAPVGTSPWALIQVYLGHQVHRSDWDAPDEYIHLVPGNGNDIAPSIQKRDKHGMLTSWQPTQEDLMACDWNLLKSETKPKPDDCMLSFDLKIGTSSGSSGQDCGYLADEEFAGAGEHPFGTLTNLQNKTDITKFSYFALNGGGIWIRVSSDNSQEGYQKMVELFKKNLTVTVGSLSYHLGSTEYNSSMGIQPYEFHGGYSGIDATNLGDLLTQNVGNTLSFCFNWK
ncbi:Thoeris anti-defense Tad2 family protein [Xenorhabdus budapestensis]|uniref:Thoeris anti-defense Tad2 family protein n=1 Tax=Xenorhabdus budapestensis TaxID=290110 RepID=UPI003A8775B2